MRKALWPAAMAVAIALAGIAVLRQPRSSAEAPAADAIRFRHVATIRDLMHMLVEPASNVLFDAVQVEVTADGIKETQPRTDQDWDALERNMVGLAEAANLLKMTGRPVARPEEMSVDPEGPDLAPVAIARLIERNRAVWGMRSDDLLDGAVSALEAVRARDVKGILTVGSALDDTCDACHEVFWYPDD